MLQSILLNVFFIFLIDLAIIVGALIVIYFVALLINIIRNGKNHKITKRNPLSFTLSKFTTAIRCNCSQLVKWIAIIFAIHLLLAFLDSILGWAKDSVTYEKVPLFALAIDILKPIFQVILPILLPIVGLFLGAIGIYALSKAVEKSPRKRKVLKTITAPGAAPKVVATTKKEPNPENKGFWALFFQYFQSGLLAVAKWIPKLFIIIAVCVGLNSLFISINNITKIVDDVKAIQELNVTVKNLSNSEAFVRVKLLAINPSRNGRAPIKTYKIQVLSANGDVVSEQVMELEGNQIVIDSININFDYSKIANGDKYNIAYPYRIYSEIIPSSNAKELNCMFNEKKIPVIYCLENDNIYGLEKDVFYKRLEEIFQIIKNDNLSKEAGIRSTIGNAIHLTMDKDEIIDISIEGTGGLSVSKHQTLFDDENE